MNLGVSHWAEVALKKLARSTGPYKILLYGEVTPLLELLKQLSDQGELDKVWVSELSPQMTGVKKTAYLLEEKKINYEIIPDMGASYLMSRGEVHGVFSTGYMICENADSLAPLGAMGLAIQSQFYDIPFLITTELDCFNMKIKKGMDIEISTRAESEILQRDHFPHAPYRAKAFNPEAEVVEASLITVLVCEKTMIKNPNKVKIQTILGDEF